MNHVTHRRSMIRLPAIGAAAMLAPALAPSLAPVLLALVPRTGGAQQAGAEDKGVPLPRVGTPLAVPALTLLDGTRFDPAQGPPRLLVLYWWASWCPFCALQSPHIEALWRKERERGLTVMGLSIDKRAEDAAAYLAKRGYTFPSAHVTPALAAALPKPRGLPVTVVRGRDGRVLEALPGQMFPEDVEAIARFL